MNHTFCIEDWYIMGGIITSCSCGWRGKVHKYNWIRNNFGDYNIHKPDLGNGDLSNYLEIEWEEHTLL